MQLDFVAKLDSSQLVDPHDVPFVAGITWASTTIFVLGRFQFNRPQFMRPPTKIEVLIEDFGVKDGKLPILSQNRDLDPSSYLYNENYLIELETRLVPVLTTFLSEAQKENNAGDRLLP